MACFGSVDDDLICDPVSRAPAHRAVHRVLEVVVCFATLVVYEVVLRSRVPSPTYRTSVLFRGEIRYLVDSASRTSCKYLPKSRRLRDATTDLLLAVFA